MGFIKILYELRILTFLIVLNGISLTFDLREINIIYYLNIYTFSNCNKELLVKYVKVGANLAGFSRNTVDYIVNLIECDMEHSYFREPHGIFKTLSGFSMGDVAASRGSEVILRGAELEIYELLHKEKLFDIVKRYLRFKDDISVHLAGDKDKMIRAMEIITCNYPKDIQLNVETNVIQGKFLNLRLYNVHGDTKAYTTILRKSNAKYDIIPPHSNTHSKYKSCAARTYFGMIDTHCSNETEKVRQHTVVNKILELKGYNSKVIKNMKKDFNKPKSETKQEMGKYIGKVEYCDLTKTHVHMQNIFKAAKNEDSKWALPMAVPGKKLLQYIFTISKMKKKLEF